MWTLSGVTFCWTFVPAFATVVVASREMGTSGANFSGRRFSSSELSLIQELIESCGGLSRMELARTVCELLDWKRPTGKLKARECREFLERLEGEGRLELPDKRPGKPVGTRTRIPQTERGEPSEPLEGELSEIQPVVLEVVRSDEQRLLFRELVDRHHYLGHAVPFGAHLRYLCTHRRRHGWWAVCSCRVRRGGWRHEICGLDGTMPRAGGTCSEWLTTAAF